MSRRQKKKKNFFTDQSILLYEKSKLLDRISQTKNENYNKWFKFAKYFIDRKIHETWNI